MNSIRQSGQDSSNVINRQKRTASTPIKHIVPRTDSNMQIGSWSRMLADLLIPLAILAVATLGALSSLDVPGAVQSASGLLAALFIPGYAAVCFLFPRASSLDGLGRVGLSCALSIATISLAAIVLESTGAEVTGRTLVATLAAATTIFTVLAIARRAATSPNDRYIPRIELRGTRERDGWPTPDRRVLLVAGVAGMLFVGSAVNLLASYAQDEPSTEFALLNAAGEPEFYDRHFRAGETISLMLEITNREGTEQQYTIHIVSQGMTIGEPLTVNLADGENWREVVNLALPTGDGLYPVTFDLYRITSDGEAEPYRSVRLMVSAS